MNENHDLKIGTMVLIGVPTKKRHISGLGILDYFHHGKILATSKNQTEFLVGYENRVSIWWSFDTTRFKIVK